MSRAETIERSNRIIAMAEDGLTANQIADRMGSHPCAIRKVLNYRNVSAARAVQGFDWSDEAVAMLRACVERGDTYARAAKAITATFPGSVTRNAAIGKALRIGLKAPEGLRMPKKDKPPVLRLIKRVPFESSGPAMARTKPKSIVLTAIAATTEPRHYITRARNECAWPIDGEGHETRSCCAPVARGSYCAEHAKLAYTAAPPPKKRNHDMKHYLRRAS